MANTILLSKNSFGNVGLARSSAQLNLHITNLLDNLNKKFKQANDNLDFFILNWNLFISITFSDEVAKKYLIGEIEQDQAKIDQEEIDNIFASPKNLATNLELRLNTLVARYYALVDKNDYNAWHPTKINLTLENTGWSHSAAYNFNKRKTEVLLWNNYNLSVRGEASNGFDVGLFNFWLTAAVRVDMGSASNVFVESQSLLSCISSYKVKTGIARYSATSYNDAKGSNWRARITINLWGNFVIGLYNGQ